MAATRRNIRYTPLNRDDDDDGDTARGEDLRFAYRPKALDRIPWKSIGLALFLLALGCLLLFLAFFIFTGHMGGERSQAYGLLVLGILAFLPDDILLKAELDRLAATYPNFKVFYTVSDPSKNWRGGTGFVSEDMVLKGLPNPGEDSLILVCGPPGMMNHVSGDKAKDRSQGELTGLLKQLGYTEDMVYKF